MIRVAGVTGSPTASSDQVSAQRSVGHSFPFQLQSLARKWSNLIPADAFVDFEAAEDVIDRHERLLDASIQSHKDVRDLQVSYERCRLELSGTLTDAATIVSMALIRNNVTSTTHREAYKEYAALHQKMFNYLIDRTNRLLGRYRAEVPDLGPAHGTVVAIWPTEQLSILNEFVEMTRDLSWVHQRRRLGSSHDLIVIDYDQIELGVLQLFMAITYIIAVYSVPTAVHFTIRSIGMNQSGLTALLLTVSWPLHLLRALNGRRRSDLRFSDFVSLSVLWRGVVLGGLSTSCAMLRALAIHGMPLYPYVVVFTMSSVIVAGVVHAHDRSRARLASMTIAIAALVLILLSTPDKLLLCVAVITAILPECHEQAKRRLIKPDAHLPLEQHLVESDAISSMCSFVAMVVILSAVGDWRSIRLGTQAVTAASWPAFLAICFSIAESGLLTDYVGEQLQADGRVSLNLLRIISYVIAMAFGLGLFREAYTPLAISAVALSLVALLLGMGSGQPAARRRLDMKLNGGKAAPDPLA